MKIIELLIDKLEDFNGFDAVALVEEPAIELDFFAFNNKEVLDTIEFELIKLAIKEQLVETRISSIKDTSNGNGGSALGFSTQTGGDSPVERMRIDKDGIVSFGAALSNAPTTRGRLILNGAGGISTTSGIEFHTSSGGGAGYGSRIFGDGDMSLFIATRANSSTWLKRASFKYYSRFSNSGSFIYGSGYNFHEFNNDSGNQPIAVFAQASGSGSHYGINVINNDDENDTTSRFFMGQGGSTERIKIFSNGRSARSRTWSRTLIWR